MKGVNAGVVGILFAALFNPVYTSGIQRPADLEIAVTAFAMLVYFKLAPWIVVLVAAIPGPGHTHFYHKEDVQWQLQTKGSGRIRLTVSKKNFT